MSNPWPYQADCPAFYGDASDPDFVSRNIVAVTPPFAMQFENIPVTHILVHRKVAESLKRILDAIWVASGKNQAVIDAWHVNVYGGAYVHRDMRGQAGKTSMHAYGAAIDLAPNLYPMHDSSGREFPKPIRDAFEAEGWLNLHSDRMHFQAARIHGEEVPCCHHTPAPAAPAAPSVPAVASAAPKTQNPPQRAPIASVKASPPGLLGWVSSHINQPTMKG